ncbi:segregation and condensation protein A [Rhizomicrobium palustre]|uniref:Segregation and condensation protein A n=1 Tax=Rhizomicrobium palustre TaxID=189966 RepID=A0A846N2I4_9PROT|nr:ScpA family protein [Rhizomicrobium palustre]NIK90204.1 segregation and condensation protein A [Rhizomicrobium palustre]
MSEELSESFENFETAAAPDETLVVQVDGFEGPLDLLLTLARSQKVDIAKISILKLAEQYLEFIEQAKRMNLELAADYLVMAAWLAYLKSRLILPKPETKEGEPSADEMAARLRWRLLRLNAIREAAARLMAGDRLGREIFVRGMPEPVAVIKVKTYTDSMYDLLSAYAADRAKKMRGKNYQLKVSPVMLIDQARERLERMFGKISDWSSLDKLLPEGWTGGPRRRSAMASMFMACLEAARDGRVELRQITHFEPLYIRDLAKEAST